MAPRTSLFDVRGRSGLVRFGGTVYEQLHPKLRGQNAVRVYTEMRDNDAIIGAFLFLIDMIMRQAPWTVEPASEDEPDIKAAEFLESCRVDMSHTWEDLISEILSMLVFGWSYFEICYKRRLGRNQDPTKRSRYRDGLTGWRKIEIRAQESWDEWEFAEDNSLRGMWQRAAPYYERAFIPIEKALLFRPKMRKGNPEGCSILQNAYRSWFILKRLQNFEAIGVERDASGIPVLEVPQEMMMPDAPAELKALRSELEQMISEIKRDEREGILIPAEVMTDDTGREVRSGYKLRLLQSGGQRQIDVDKSIRRYESRIAMTVMAEFILLGTDKVGSFALADNKTNLFAVAIGTWMNAIAAVFNQYAVPRLFEVNAWELDNLPRLVPGDIERPALDGIAKFLESLTRVGVIQPDKQLERELRRMAHLPAPEEAEDVL